MKAAVSAQKPFKGLRPWGIAVRNSGKYCVSLTLCHLIDLPSLQINVFFYLSGLPKTYSIACALSAFSQIRNKILVPS